MDSNSHLCKCIKNLLRDFLSLWQNDQHFVEPLAADILGCICKIGYDWHALDFVSRSVLIYQNNASRTNTDIVETKHIFHYRLRLFLSCNDQKGTTAVFTAAAFSQYHFPAGTHQIGNNSINYTG